MPAKELRHSGTYLCTTTGELRRSLHQSRLIGMAIATFPFSFQKGSHFIRKSDRSHYDN
ncbi:hypothetical protein [Spirulina sp. 06S082]|uniref:hypothetical protein n=1 Tax=Spirulina sp. 06S082 TaxID=3110248 RepID=UPI002B20909F|nr:hypothetical protein [Spirulina sp. 06S082]MEA5467604.1 hypothetical protein [Spirulina sp. 06S082]